MNYQIELFHSLLQEFLSGESALLTLEGEVLAIKGQNPLSFGTLATAAGTVAKYIPLKEGDIVILNDPYSGGTTLNEMTFVTAISEDLLWVTRIPYANHIVCGKSIEDEGIRIPPTPIFQNGKMNEMILGAIGAHPCSPPDFVTWIKNQCEQLAGQIQKFVEAIEVSGLSVTSELIEDYWQLSKKTAEKMISDRPYGETRVDVVLDSGELLRLNLDLRDKRIFMDFSGSTAGKTVHLTESAAASVCFHTMAKYYGFQDFVNAGTLSLLQITKPSGCWLLAKYPAPTLKGMTSGTAAVLSSIELALSHIHGKSQTALSSHCPVQIEFKNAEKFQAFQIFGGTSGHQGQAGQAGNISALSIEQMERSFPIRIDRIAERESPGGTGQFAGGRGLTLQIQILKDLEVRWLTDLTLHRPRLTRQCSHGDPGEISLLRAGKVRTLPMVGLETFTAGDILTFSSATGGGSGPAPATPKSS